MTAAAVCMMLFAVTMVMCALHVQSLERGVPHAVVISTRATGITMKQITAFSGKISAGAMTDWSLLNVGTPGTGASAPAYTAYATPGMGFSLPYTYTYGNWFHPGNELTPCAVLPESLSLSLFGTDQPSGGSVLIDGTEYKVFGVYREEKGFLHKLSTDGIARVYLFDPLRMAEVPATTLYLTGAEGSDAQFLKQQVSGALKMSLAGGLADYRPRIQLAGSLWYLSVLVCALITAALLLHAAGRQLILAASAQKETGVRRLLRLSIGAAVTAAVLFGLSLLFGRLRVPPAYLPQDNIFDLSFYIKAVEAFFQSYRGSGGTNIYDPILVTQFLALLFWSFLGIVFFFIGALKLRRGILMISANKEK